MKGDVLVKEQISRNKRPLLLKRNIVVSEEWLKKFLSYFSEALTKQIHLFSFLLSIEEHRFCKGTPNS